jgi:beta-glucuronidase
MARIPTSNKDWWNYGGITRSVKLAVLSPTFIRDYRIALTSHTDKSVSASATLDGNKANQKVTLSIPELNISEEAVTDSSGTANFAFNVADATLWSPTAPQQYEVTFSTELDSLSDKVGFRTIATE